MADVTLADGSGNRPSVRQTDDAKFGSVCGMERPGQDSQTYRLIGINADGSRQVIAGGLTVAEAFDLFMEHMDSDRFHALEVEQEVE